MKKLIIYYVAYFKAKLIVLIGFFFKNDHRNLIRGIMDNEMGDAVEKTLECPVCRETMRPPIYLCSIGHSICFTCKPRIEKCPTCKSGWSSARNFSLESLTSKYKYKCTKSSDGCTKEGYLDEIEKHEQLCEFISWPCPIRDSHKCDWKGSIHKLEAHLSIYKTDYFAMEKVFFIPYKSNVRAHIIKQNNEFFRITVKSMDNNLTKWTYEHIHATPYEKPQYEIEFSFKNQVNDGSVLKVAHSCQNWLVGKSDLGMSLPNEILLPFVNNVNKIKYAIALRKISE